MDIIIKELQTETNTNAVYVLLNILLVFKNARPACLIVLQDETTADKLFRYISLFNAVKNKLVYLPLTNTDDNVVYHYLIYKTAGFVDKSITKNHYTDVSDIDESLLG